MMEIVKMMIMMMMMMMMMTTTMKMMMMITQLFVRIELSPMADVEHMLGAIYRIKILKF